MQHQTGRQKSEAEINWSDSGDAVNSFSDLLRRGVEWVGELCCSGSLYCMDEVNFFCYSH
jgi:hypothetical protein